MAIALRWLGHGTLKTAKEILNFLSTNKTYSKNYRLTLKTSPKTKKKKKNPWEKKSISAAWFVLGGQVLPSALLNLSLSAFSSFLSCNKLWSCLWICTSLFPVPFAAWWCLFPTIYRSLLPSAPAAKLPPGCPIQHSRQFLSSLSCLGKMKWLKNAAARSRKRQLFCLLSRLSWSKQVKRYHPSQGKPGWECFYLWKFHAGILVKSILTFTELP